MERALPAGCSAASSRCAQRLALGVVDGGVGGRPRSPRTPRGRALPGEGERWRKNCASTEVWTPGASWEVEAPESGSRGRPSATRGPRQESRKPPSAAAADRRSRPANRGGCRRRAGSGRRPAPVRGEAAAGDPLGGWDRTRRKPRVALGGGPRILRQLAGGGERMGLRASAGCRRRRKERECRTAGVSLGVLPDHQEAAVRCHRDRRDLLPVAGVRARGEVGRDLAAQGGAERPPRRPTAGVDSGGRSGAGGASGSKAETSATLAKRPAGFW